MLVNPMESLDQVTNFIEISPSLGTSGMPARELFAAIAQAGYQVVINLSMPESSGQQPDERELVEGLGMDYIHIPVVWESPQLTDLERFFQALDENQDRRVFAHCVLNYRVSAFVYLYRTLRQGISHEQAWSDLTRIWTPEGTWEAFIQSTRLASLGSQG